MKTYHITCYDTSTDKHHAATVRGKTLARALYAMQLICCPKHERGSFYVWSLGAWHSVQEMLSGDMVYMVSCDKEVIIWANTIL